MGSVAEHRERGESNASWLRREVFPSSELLDVASVGSTLYAAVRLGEWAGEDAGRTIGFVILTRWDRTSYHNFWHKEMSEDEGPYESQCPARILDLLDPTESEYALAWRQRCREHAARVARGRSVRPGTRVRFSQPLEFTDGHTGDTFTLVERSTFRAVETGLRYRIPSWRGRSYEVVA